MRDICPERYPKLWREIYGERNPKLWREISHGTQSTGYTFREFQLPYLSVLKSSDLLVNVKFGRPSTKRRIDYRRTYKHFRYYNKKKDRDTDPY